MLEAGESNFARGYVYTSAIDFAAEIKLDTHEKAPAGISLFRRSKS
jgi:hypothetical protein